MKIIEILGIDRSEDWLFEQQKIVEPIVENNTVSILRSALQYAHEMYELPVPDLTQLLRDYGDAVLRIAEFAMIAGILHGINAVEMKNKGIKE